MDNYLSISIIIPVYNSAPYLEKCLNSCLTQSYPIDKIICINDGSQDNSLEIIKKYSTNFNNVIVCSQDNRGVSSARNKGLSYLPNNGFVMFVDSDDYLDKYYVEKFANQVSTDTDIIIELPDDTEKELLTKEELFLYLINHPQFRGPYRKLISNNLARNNHFNETMYVGEDLVFDANIFIKCNISKGVKNGGYFWQFNPNSLTHKKDNNSSIVRYKRVFDTCYSWYMVFGLLIEKNFYESDILRKGFSDILAVEYLEYYGSSNRFNKLYKHADYLKMIDINKTYNILKNYSPLLKKQKIKKIMYSYFRPLYKITRLLYKATSNINS